MHAQPTTYPSHAWSPAVGRCVLVGGSPLGNFLKSRTVNRCVLVGGSPLEFFLGGWGSTTRGPWEPRNALVVASGLASAAVPGGLGVFKYSKNLDLNLNSCPWWDHEFEFLALVRS